MKLGKLKKDYICSCDIPEPIRKKTKLWNTRFETFVPWNTKYDREEENTELNNWIIKNFPELENTEFLILVTEGKPYVR